MCPYIHMSPHTYVHPGTSGRPSVRHFCVCQYIHLSIGSSFACLQLYDCQPVKPVDQHHSWSLAVSCMADFSTYVFWVLFLLLLSVWTGGLWMCAQAMCCRLVLIVVFFVVFFIMSQTSATTATTTTSPVTVVCSGTLPVPMAVTMASTLMELPATLGQHDVVLPLPPMLRGTRDVGLATVPQQQPQCQMLLQAYSHYASHLLQVSQTSH